MNKIDRRLNVTSYEADYARWCTEQASLLRAGRLDALDRDNLAEEINSLGRRERREVESRLTVLVHHLLKWQVQPGRRSESWRISISEQRIWIPDILADNPSLKRQMRGMFATAYVKGKRSAVSETGLRAELFPDSPPFTLSEALSPEFWPDDGQDNPVVLRD